MDKWSGVSGVSRVSGVSGVSEVSGVSGVIGLSGGVGWVELRRGHLNDKGHTESERGDEVGGLSAAR